jgi:hypothetical protein
MQADQSKEPDMEEQAIELPEPAAKIRRWTTNSASVDMAPPLLRSANDGDGLYTADQARAAAMRYAAKAVAPYITMYMELSEAMGYPQRGRENDLVSPEEYAANLLAASRKPTP